MPRPAGPGSASTAKDDIHVILEYGAGLGLLLLALAVWQRRVERRHRKRVVGEIREARATGRNRPVGQYPQIDPLACIGCGSCVRACPENGVLELVGGVAHVVAASRCIGHAMCEAVCPVNALKVGLGDTSRRPDIPQLDGDLQSDVDGLYIAGELGGLALIRHAVEQGVRAVDAIAKRARATPPARGFHDVIIVGAGPAGLTASLRAVELGLSHVTIDQDDLGGTVRKYPRRKLVMTQAVDLPLGERLDRSEYRKEELLEFWERVCERHGVVVQGGAKLTGVTRHPAGFEIATTRGELGARFVLLAMGRRGTPRRLGVPGEERETVLYQLVDASTYTGRDLLVVGGGDSAIEAATALADQPGNRVVLSYRKPDFFRLKSRNEERIRRYAREGRIRLRLGSTVREIRKDAVLLEESTPGEPRVEVIPVDYTFVFAGGEPPYPLLRAAGVRFGAAEAVA